jgi:hypothetical protein
MQTDRIIDLRREIFRAPVHLDRGEPDIAHRILKKNRGGAS